MTDTLNAQVKPAPLTMGSMGDRIALRSARVRVVVAGALATTELELEYYNPMDRVQQGDFSILLEPGWTLGRFALDINGRLRDAVAVPKDLGRQAYESVVRRGVDPALVEMDQGNRFKARVYPFSPRGTRRVVVTLDNTLVLKDGRLSYQFPYTFTEELAELTFDLRVLQRPAKQLRVEGLPGVTAVEGNEEVTYSYKAQRVTLSQPVRVELPSQKVGELLVAEQGGEYVYVADMAVPAKSIKPKKPGRVVVLWDASASAAKANRGKQLGLLREYLKWMAKGEVEFVPFWMTAGEARKFKVENGVSAELIAAVEAVEYAGGTDFGCLSKVGAGADRILLFSDGVGALGDNPLPTLGAPVLAINASASARAMRLEALAIATGGAYVDLTTTPTERALATIQEGNVRIDGWSTGTMRHPSTIATSLGGRVWLAGRGQRAPEKIEATLKTPEGSETLTVKGNGAVWHTELLFNMLLRRAVQAEMLQLRYKAKDEEAEQLAQRYGIATERTSLIVLEQLSDYVRFRIVPPPELRDEYNAILKNQAVESQQSAAAQIEALVRESNEQTEWWEGKLRPKPVRPEPRGLGGAVAGTARNETRSRSSSEAAKSMAAPEAAMVKSAAPMDLAAAADGAGNATEPNGATEAAAPQGTIRMAAWRSDSPYLKVLEYAEPSQRWATYLRMYGEYADLAAFHIEVAEYFIHLKEPQLAFRAVTSALELSGDNPEILRAVLRVLVALGKSDLAERLARRIMELAPWEPQCYRDLAHLLIDRGEYQAGIELLYKVATGQWDFRFHGIQLISMNEINHLYMRPEGKKLDFSMVDKRLLKKEPVAMRAVLTWANDDTDIDLHVVEPEGEECYFGRRYTMAGGRLSNDITQGYGPEEYMRRNASKGKYRFRVRFFANRTQRPLAPQYVYVRIYLNYGSANEQVQELRLKLTSVQEMSDVGEIEYK